MEASSASVGTMGFLAPLSTHAQHARSVTGGQVLGSAAFNEALPQTGCGGDDRFGGLAARFVGAGLAGLVAWRASLRARRRLRSKAAAVGAAATARRAAGASNLVGAATSPATAAPAGATALRAAAVSPVDAAAVASSDAVAKLEEYVKAMGGDKVIRKILIANNGMAATKAILSMRQWAYLQLGLENVFEFVVMATKEDLDANAEFISLADSYVEVPGGKNVNNYANVDLICETAKANGVDAVWPGWGHASENPKLPAGLKDLGIVFIGPPSPVMSVLGDKIAANILAQTAGVPSIPWSGDGLQAELTPEGTIPREIFDQGLIRSFEEAVECANRIGYPVMLKASEGGGGKGIRMNANVEELEANYPQVLAELPGSPVFMMQLCKGARHIEVQIVGDQHGKAIALNGRDCSTQRRFQKIFEEGPPTIVPKETFREMEKAAQRLTQSIGYVGAGTVEYLYNAEENNFYFLELNPRLQVEHPVTEEVTGVNLPATQLQVLMGIPLENIPQIRTFYGKEEGDTSGIDFLEDNYVYPKKHVIAARITAENPDDSFKPTSGKIERIKFQSSLACWGYFSVGANGAIHEYADSQFGHIFAHGNNREEARKALTLALRNMEVVGEIRSPIEYLVELADTEAFKANTIDTSWLDGILKAKSVKMKYNRFDVVFYAAVFRAMQSLKKKEDELLQSLSKSQLGPVQNIAAMNRLAIQIAFEGVRYDFKVIRCGPGLLTLSIGGQNIQAKVRTQTDGAIFVTVGKSVMKIFGTEEPLGLRLRMDGVATIMLPTLYDASELRSEFNGKVVRYLQDNGGVVKEGETYVELEAMKMIMPIKATASGRITHTRGAGSIVSAGELLGSLELEDPSSVQQLVTFNGQFAPSALADGAAGEEEDVESQVDLLLDGYASTATPSVLATQLFADIAEADYPEASRRVLDKYLSVEETFARLMNDNVKGNDQMCLALIAENKDSLDKVAQLALAHSQVAARSDIVMTVLRDLRWGPRTTSAPLMDCLTRLANLPGRGDYAEVSLLARLVAEKVSSKPFEERQQELRSKLDAQGLDLQAIAVGPSASVGVELLSSLLGDSSMNVRSNALEVYLRRSHRSFSVSNMSLTDEGPARMRCTWQFQYPSEAMGTAEPKMGMCTVVPTLGDLPAALKGPLPLKAAPGEAVPANMFEIIIAPDAFPSVVDRTTFYSSDAEFQATIPKIEAWLAEFSDELRAAGVRHIVVTQVQSPFAPRHAFFPFNEGFHSCPSRNDMRPSFPHLLEVGQLSDSFELQRIVPTIGRNSQVFLGTKLGVPAGKRGPPKTVFVRTVTTRMNIEGIDQEGWNWPAGLLVSALDEIERARLNPVVGQQPNSDIYANFVSPIDQPLELVTERLEFVMNEFVSKYGTRLQSMKVDEIVIKAGVGAEATGRTHTLRITASSMNGEYLKIYTFLEKEDPTTGRPVEWTDIRTGENVPLDIFSKSKLAGRFTTARAAGSTYAPAFLGMMKVELIKRWNDYSQALGGSVQIPADTFHDIELVLGNTGELEESDRPVGSNNVGMLAWRCTMKTPEYRDGREIVLIANDVTHQAGSFGVAEDVFFQKASEYARKKGLPRIYIACNSGARVGLVEELKPYVKAKWTDEENPSKGFDYLYLEEEDYKRFEEGTVVAREVTSGGSKHYAIEAVIGSGLKSTAGGIGVENLQGSGLIAGETSRAYNEVFTLSYITGRSVGIGAYLNRLGQRTIQMVNGPMILTGYGALNKLLGRQVYSSQDQLGGPQVMVPNGVTHQLVQSDQEGVTAILDWLSFVPRDCWSTPPVIAAADPPERDVTFEPSKRPYDPRHMLAGTTTPEGVQFSGFFDEGSFKEYLPGWGKSVVVGRGKLGGIPMGVIAVETRSVERAIPADPANPASSEVLEPQAGQVWFPDSAFKTATAIRDFNRGENLPLMIFANWRGFSGGTRDMYQEVLKFGAQIVDALVDYKHPVFVYIPPGGELRGGAWVVIDPAINPAQMEMYADVESRGGILEPAGIVEVKFRKQQQIEMMHRLDPQLQALDTQLETDRIGTDEIDEKIKAREEQLLPLYTQIACEFADLHDRTGRMEAKGVIRAALEWRRSREFFYWRVRRRLLEQEAAQKVSAADPSLPAEEVNATVAGWLPVGDDKTVVAFLEKHPLDEEVEALRVAALKKQIKALVEELPESERGMLSV